MMKRILYSVEEAVRAIEQLKRPEAVAFLAAAAEKIVHCFRGGHKLLIAGNGGSLCDAAHFAEELTGQFRHRRAALPAIALTEPGHLTCVANDFGFREVFSRFVEALGQPGDLLIVLTTSGNSENILAAVEMAELRGLPTIAFLGKEGGKLKGRTNLEWIVSGFPYSDRVQEAHMAAIHILVELVERELFASPVVQRECVRS